MHCATRWHCSNHDVNASSNSGFECGVAYAHRFHMPYQNESTTDDGCAASYNVRYWYALRDILKGQCRRSRALHGIEPCAGCSSSCL